MPRHLPLCLILATLAVWPAARAQSQALSLGGELRLLATDRQAAAAGPLAAAHALQPTREDTPPSSAAVEAEVTARWRGLQAQLLLQHERPTGGPGHSQARFNELHASADLGPWQLSAGRKVVSWDVGYAFRPNDMVQQEQRRGLLGTAPQGQPLLQAEWFGADQALSLVWAHPRTEAAQAPREGTAEQALALRAYQRLGAADLYAFARQGHDLGAAAGLAASWVPGEALELHASARWQAHHRAWQFSGMAPETLATASPWRLARHGSAGQLLLGGQWTGAAGQSLMAEAWHDATAPSAAQWRDWRARNATLTQLPAHLPASLLPAVAGNLAWQTDPLSTLALSSLQRKSVFLRTSWQPPELGSAWQFSLDTLIHPDDHGRLLTTAAQWQGDRWKLNAAWRQTGGPRDSVLAQLPTRRTLLGAATLAF
ncbi:hypothetical protein [Ideonella livida]|uniref:TonB-dependent receptor n=1 Tax=Ideonella livida TaxID=2707176 RepID=A0A7C9TJH5_9BURK|nr:hypothetical protein [Ideonella livida]NDY90227.1 hypothetical protein [Ideonella livida]